VASNFVFCNFEATKARILLKWLYVSLETNIRMNDILKVNDISQYFSSSLLVHFQNTENRKSKPVDNGSSGGES